MKFVAIIALLFVLSEARLPVPYDVYVKFGGKPVPKALRREGELYYLADEKTNGSKIVGGETAVEGDAPWIVSIRMSSHFCGGSIKDSNTIITAAHCVLGDTPSSLSIRYNCLQHASGGTLVGVSKITTHPNYSSSTIDYDVAILKLVSNLNLGSTQAQAVQLPAQGSDPTEGTDTLVAGWGTTSSGGGSLPENLLKVIVPIVSRTTCRSQYGTSAITDQMICAGLPQGGKDACQGDSGGPLTVNGVLIGIVSWGRGCALANYAGVYSNVGALRSWIDSNSA